MKKVILSIVVIMCSALSAIAQGDSPKLSKEEMMEFAERIAQKIDDFQSSLSIICSKKSTKETRNIVIKECLDLFIGQGNDYYTPEDAYGNREFHDAVTIQITSKNNPTKKVPIKQYLTTLSNSLSRWYTKVEITSSQAVRVDNLHETADGRYECVAYFYQEFKGYRDGRLVYKDITHKKVRVYLEQIEGPVGKTWSIALGDISAIQTI